MERVDQLNRSGHVLLKVSNLEFDFDVWFSSDKNLIPF